MNYYSVIKEYFVPGLMESQFDPEKKFTSNVRKGFGEIYEAASGYETRIYSADEMISGEKQLE